jgi:hypothetical protein
MKQTEDLSKEAMVVDIFGFDPVATESAVGGAQVAGFPRQVEEAEGVGRCLPA